MKRLTKSRKNRVMDGVLGGIGEYFNIDPVIVRIVFVIFSIFTAFWGGVVMYIIAMIIIPSASKDEFTAAFEHSTHHSEDGSFRENHNYARSESQRFTYSNNSRNGGVLFGVLFIVIGGVFLLNNLLDYNLFHYIGKYREYFWAVGLIVIGAALLFLGGKRR